MKRNVLALCGSLLLAGTLASARLPARADEPEASSEVKEPRIEPKADELLRRMSEFLGKARSLRVVANHVTEVVTKDGQKLQFMAESTVALRRPNRLRTDRKGQVIDASLFYDGKTISVYGRKANVYAVADAPATLDEAIDFTRARLGAEAPAADLLYADPYTILTEDVVSGTYVGMAQVNGVACHQLAFRGNETDWQIWIRDGSAPVPCRYVITTKDVDGAPEFAVDLSGWEIGPKLPDSLFSFKPPQGAEKLPFLGLSEPRGGSRPGGMR